MADDDIKVTDPPAAPATPAEPAVTTEETRRKGDGEAWKLLRDRDRRMKEQDERIKRLEASLAGRGDGGVPAAGSGTDEPDVNENPGEWLKWSREQDKRERTKELQQLQFAQQNSEINAWATGAEAQARAKFADYDDGIKWLKKSYTDELAATGELDQAAVELMADPSKRELVTNHALNNGMSEVDAARDLCAAGAFEWRRQRIVAAQRRLGGNPAEEAYKLATARGYKRGGPTVDATLAEMERKRALRDAGQTTADIREGGEPRDKRVWTNAELQELQRTNPQEFRRAIKDIASQADAEGSEFLGAIIKH